MKVVERLDLFAKKVHEPIVASLGNFDGVHLGHQAIFQVVKEKAKRLKGRAAVATFENHPQLVLGHKKGPLLLTSFFHKLFLLEEVGIDTCFLLQFSKEFSQKSPETFVKEILVDQIGARAVCLGPNARFGYERSGDAALMKKLAAKYSFDFEEVSSLKWVPNLSAARSFAPSFKKENLGRRPECWVDPIPFMER